MLVEKLPAAHAFRGFQPDIGGIYPAVAFDTGGNQILTDDLGVFQIIGHHVFHLRPPLAGINNGGGLLHRTRDPVELGALTAVPQLVKRYLFAGSGSCGQLLGNHREPAANAGEAGGL